jgi:hypothetical protein
MQDPTAFSGTNPIKIPETMLNERIGLNSPVDGMNQAAGTERGYARQ